MNNANVIIEYNFKNTKTSIQILKLVRPFVRPLILKLVRPSTDNEVYLQLKIKTQDALCINIY